MTRYENIPYRRWKSARIQGTPHLIETAIYKRVMKRVGEAMRAGKAVTMNHVINCAEPKRGVAYDLVSITIQD